MKCKICLLFDCGKKCICVCHFAPTNKILNNSSPENSTQLISKRDIDLIVAQTNVSRLVAKNALKKAKGDLVDAVFSILDDKDEK